MWLSLLTNKYVLIIGAVLLVVCAFWFQFGGSIMSWKLGIPQAEKATAQSIEEAKALRLENQRLLSEYATTQTAVRGLSQKIMELRKEADNYKTQAAYNLTNATKYEQDAQIMAIKLQALLKQRAEERKVQSLQEAKDAFKKAGIE